MAQANYRIRRPQTSRACYKIEKRVVSGACGECGRDGESKWVPFCYFYGTEMETSKNAMDTLKALCAADVKKVCGSCGKPKQSQRVRGRKEWY